MATEPQSTSQAPFNTSLRETSVWSIDTYPKIWEGGRVKKQASEKATQAKAHGNALQTSLEPPKYPRQHRCIGLVLTLPKLYLASLKTIQVAFSWGLYHVSMNWISTMFKWK